MTITVLNSPFAERLEQAENSLLAVESDQVVLEDARGGIPHLDADFGGVADDSTDNAAAIAAWCAAVVAAGGRGEVGPGIYRTSGPLDFRNCRKGIQIRGVGNIEAQTVSPPSQFVYTAASGPLVQLGSAHGVEFTGVSFRYNNPAYADHLIVGGHGTSGLDARYLDFIGCMMGGMAGAAGALSCILLDKTLETTFDRCHFVYADRAVWGRNGSYSNVVRLQSTRFHAIAQAPVYNPGESWTIDGCTFEPLTDGRAGALGSDGGFTKGLRYVGNWHGDVTVDGGKWISNLKTLGGEISGGTWGAPGPVSGTHIEMIGGTESVDIGGMNFQGPVGCVAISFASATCRAVRLGAIDYGATTPVSGEANCATLVRLGNDDTPNQIKPGLGVQGALSAAQRSDTTNRVLFGELSALPAAQAAIIAYLIGVAGLTSGSVGIFPRTNIATAETALFGGDAATPDLRVGKAKLGFYGTAPIAKPAAPPADATDLASAIALVNDLKAKLIAQGLR